MNIYEKLTAIQNKLKAPKNAKNDFGGFNYRRIDDINEKLKPLLDDFRAAVTLEDSLELIGDRYYVRSVAKFTDTEVEGSQIISAVGWAREPLSKKGSDESQITGAATTYARKYALTALFLLDDSANDPDSQLPKCQACGADVKDKKQVESSLKRWNKVICKKCVDKKKAEYEAKKKAEEIVTEAAQQAKADLPFPI